MNLKPSILTIISAISCTSFIGDAMAASCKYAGWYRWRENGVSKDWCMPCPAGCYCPHAADDKDRAPNQWMSCASGLQKYGIYKCDDGYTSVGNTGVNPNTDKTYWQGAMSENECFFKAKDTGNKVRYSSAVTCPAGQYIKAGNEKCQACKTGYICPGVPMLSNGTKVKASTTWDSSWKKATYKLWPNPNHDEGIYLCPSGTVANSSHTACETGSTYCAAGKYLPANATTCTTCKDRYYCLGGSFKKASFDQGLKTCPAGKKPDSLKKSCIKDTSASSSNSGKSVSCPAGQYLPANATSCKECKDRYYCLGGTFTTSSSDQGLKTCYRSQPNATKTNCVVTCSSGYYLPSKQYTCQKCKDGYTCPGGTYITGQNHYDDQGLLNADEVVAKKASCKAGQYLPANATDCTTCKDRYYCLGGTYYKASYDQGLRNCPANSAPNASRTACEYGAFNCEPGTYLPAKGTKCVSCPTTRNYCPGGTFKQDSYDQGLKVCPNMTTANSKRTACTITLTKNQMQYGMTKGETAEIDEQCWSKQTMDDYVNCMFGKKMVVSYTTGSIVKSDEPESEE